VETTIFHFNRSNGIQAIWLVAGQIGTTKVKKNKHTVSL